MKKNWMKKAMAFAICLVLVIGLVPITAFADGTTEGAETTVTFTAISGTASATSGEGYESLLDGKYTEDNFSKWCISGTQAYIIFEASEACVVNGYSFVTGNDNASWNGRNPKDWTLYGCNSSEAGKDSADWVAIHSVTDDQTMQDVNYTKYDFAVSGQTTTYKYFMLKITAVQSGSVMQLAEMILDVTPCAHTPTDAGKVKDPTCTEEGYTLLHCSVCDYDYKKDIIAAKGHTPGEGSYCEVCDSIVCGDFMLKGGVLGTDYTYESNVLTIITDTPVAILGTTTTDRIEITDGVSANITLAGVNIDVSSQEGKAAFKIADDSTGNVTVTLADDTQNILNSGEYCAGLQKNGAYISDNQGKLTICGGELGTGSLKTIGGDDGAGIGGGAYGAGSNISIAGGTVTATGGDYAAGIGGGDSGAGSNITIDGGSVKAVAGVDANIIGGGYEYEAVIPTDGSEAANPVYLLELTVDGSSAVMINGKYYPVAHGEENKLYVYLPAASVDEPNVVLLGDDRIAGYYYDTTNAQWNTSGYSVIYKADGKVVSAQLVQSGENATVPEIPEKVGYTQTAPVWDKDGTNITADTVINAVYTINEYTVTYKAGDRVVKVEVEHGSNATAPAVPEKAGFVGKWDADGKNVTEDTTINAVYTEIPVVNPNDVTPEDKTELEDTKKQLEEMLKDDGYTENDKHKIQDAIDRIDAALAEFNDSETNSEDDSETNSNDAPADKDEGLGTGAIVAIVIGSVAIAGIGGFAIFWFVIKKKSWADLITVFKKN